MQDKKESVSFVNVFVYFLAGVTSAINESACMLVVLSEDYTSSQFCHLEMELAYYNMIDQKSIKVR